LQVIPLKADGSLDAPSPLIKDAHSAGLRVHAYTFRAENQFLPKDLRSDADPHRLGDLKGELKAYLNAGLDGFFTDHADYGVQARDAFL
jgi:glycerophosphoryl diester phosphodiesterase